MKKVLAIICLIASFAHAYAQEFDYGLRIETYPTEPTLWTSLTLESGKLVPTFGDRIGMSFELMNRQDNVFGSVFRIITDSGENIDLMYTVDRNDHRFPMLVTGDQIHPIESEITFGQWQSISISLNPDDGEIILDYAGTILTIKDAGTKKSDGFRICFGFCPFTGYALDDVASVNIRDILLTRNDKPIRKWNLSLHDGDICYDEFQQNPALGKNCHWIIDQYITWMPVMSTYFDYEPSIAFNPEGIFYFITDGKSITTYDTENAQLKTTPTPGSKYPANYANQVIYTDSTHGLIAYNLDESLFAEYDTTRKRWDGTREPVLEHDYWNNTTSWSSSEEAIISFGGYGHYLYNNEFIISHPSAPYRCVKDTLKDITPRYNSASVVIDSLMYVFGGRGNASGRQELYPKNYYDLYAINIHTSQVTKLWELETSPIGEFLPSDNMVYDDADDCFYIFSSLKGGTLIKLAKDKPGFETMSLPTETYESAQYTYRNLYLNSAKDKLYAVLLKSQVDHKSHVQVFEMHYPPIPVSTLMQSFASDKDSKSALPWILGSVAFVCFVTTVIILLLTRRRKASVKKVPATIGIRPDKSSGNTEQEDIYVPQVLYYDFSKSSICFFGGFCVKDKDGNDITSKFTFTLKALTILLILYSGNDRKGIISNKLNRLIWSYKPEEQANNNRNVYISKLRGILEEVGGIKVINENKFWSIQFEDEAMCDYLEAKRLYQENNSQNIDRLLELLLRGMMLPNVELEWVDAFKSEFSNLTIDFLCRQLERSDLDDNIKIQAANTIFQHDFLNENALLSKCKILCRHGKTGLAKSIYDNFTKEYKESIGIDYQTTFKQLIG